MRPEGRLPEIEIYNHQSAVPVDLERLRAVAVKALPLCLELALGDGEVLSGLQALEISIVDDAAIAEVHGRFLDDPTPTDVITFDHGEILVSAETAAARAGDFDNTPNRELALYLVHGLLHLAGHEDKSEPGFERLRAAQESVLGQVW